MLEFRDITLEDKPLIDSLICASGCHGADYSFANLYIWRHAYHPQMAVAGDRVIIHTPGYSMYAYPKGGGDPRPSVDAELEYAHSHGQDKLVIRGLTDRTLEEFLPIYGDLFEIKDDRDNADYMYETEKLRYLRGRKLSSKRNHIKHFERNGAWELKRIGGPDGEWIDSDGDVIGVAGIEDARNFVSTFYEEKDDPDLADEAVAIDEMFNNFDVLGFIGALLYQNGEPVAFTAATRLGEVVMDVHFEKALPGVDGAYTMINREFVNMVAQMHPEIEMFNREEDMGLPGLRKAKESYHPDLLLMKYFAVEK